MSFNTPNGTRGARQPSSGRLYKLLNNTVAGRIRRAGGKFMGMNALVLTTVGRKSGSKRSTPVAYFEGPYASWYIVASANGAANNPAWYYNIGASPDQVQIQMGGQKIDVVAHQLHGTEREQAWSEITKASPRFAKYQRQTDREIPVIRLVRAS